MVDSRDRRIVNLPARSDQSVAEVDLLLVQEVALIEASDGLERVAADRTVVGALGSTGLRPTFEKKFEKHGIEMPPHLFSGSSAPMGDFLRTA